MRAHPLADAFARGLLGQDEGHTLDAIRAEAAAQVRERCRAILTAPQAQDRFAQAATLALDTDMSVADALAVLAACATDQKAAEVPGVMIDTADAAAAWLNHLRRPS
jgi:CheY-like chemotaxis protein